MKVPRALYKKFNKETGLGFGHFCVLLVVLKQDKAGLTLLHTTDSNILSDLLKEGLIGSRLDVVKGKEFYRYESTIKGNLYSKEKNLELDPVEKQHNLNAQIVFEDFNLHRGQNNLRKNKTLSDDNRDRIIGWLRKGKTIEDFQLVHKYWFSKWKGDPEFEQWLVMSTLYKVKSDSNFEKKLDQAKNNKPKTNTPDSP